jgi:gliding motility-associated-like protein
MRKIYLIIGLLLFMFSNVWATHNRAGEITFRQISAYTYEFTITTFTYTLSPVDRDTVNILWGDNTSSAAPRIQRIELPDYYRKNVYLIRHTFPGPGVYRVVMQDPTRNYGVLNIPNSVRVYFSVETTLIINPQISNNDTPIMLNYPLDKAAVGRKFVHNPGAFDQDGDSLAYKLTTCTKELGHPIENYTYPLTSDTFYVDPIRGDLVWNAPVDTGKYNIAMNIEVWRHRVKIGNIERDMQVEVHQSNNHPPVNPPFRDLCIEAGQLIDFTFTVRDTDSDNIDVQVIGGPLQFADTVHRAKFSKVASGPGFTTMRFTWLTDYPQARKQPYTIIIRSTDDYASLKLVDISDFDVNVMAPAPKNLVTNPGNNTIGLKWSKSPCNGVVGYDIYRKSDSTALKRDTCVGGIPAGSGYIKVGSASGISDTVFQDNNNLGLGVNYCYRVVAVLGDGLRSYPSAESCSMLVPGVPSLTSASVTKIDQVQGQIFVSWIKPRPDTLKIPAPGPYVYLIYRANNFDGNGFSLIDSIQTSDLADTTYTDKNLNTELFPYDYKVALYNNTPGNRFLISNPETASSMYPSLYGSDRAVTIKFARNVPWINTQYIIYRLNPQTMNFDSIGFTNTEEYINTGLKNGQSYTYLVKAYGYRIINGLKYNTLNWSHKNTTMAIDSIKPCAPVLRLESRCKDYVNVLTWSNLNRSCADDIIKYQVYFKATLNGTLALVGTVNNSSDSVFTFQHSPPVSLGGCYAVTAVDSSNNESLFTNMLCLDSCSGYRLYNVFTPNNDGVNDMFVSYNPGNYVKKVDMKIYNRWGIMVFHTTDPAINWDGRDMNTKRALPSGVYYYICDVYEPRITGIEIRTIKDFVYIYNSPSDKPLE